MTGTRCSGAVHIEGVTVPEGGRLLDLAPVLGLRAADLLAIAGGEVPREFLPADPGAQRQVREAIYRIRRRVRLADEGQEP